jgi:hypothetical protein
MALNGWKLEHGDYPNQLADLVPSYFESLPLDLLYGIEFAYAPNGLDAKACVSATSTNSQRSQDQQDLEVSKLVYESMIEPDQPFLLPWSMARKPTRVKCTVMDGPSIKEFECYNYSGQDFLGHYPGFDFWDFVLLTKVETKGHEIAK